MNRRELLIAAAGIAMQAVAADKPRKPTALLLHRLFQSHVTGEQHPESPARMKAIEDALGAVRDKCLLIEPRDAITTELAACHDKTYLELARREIESDRARLSTGDTAVGRQSWQVALQAAGGVMVAVDAVVAARAANAFCALRPPGHHAGPARGMGFCILNNIALAVRYARDKHGIDKAMIVDWDVHHGNGTQEIFDEDPAVLFFDTHQHPWYPGTGAADDVGKGKAHGTKINVPLPAGSGRKQIIEAWEQRLLPAAQRFKPDMIFISAGFDSRQGDPLGGFTLADEDFVHMTRMLMALAADHCGGRLVSVLEGGYALKGLASATQAHVRTLMGQPADAR